MAWQTTLPNGDHYIMEDYEDEIKTAFEKADIDAQCTVEVLYFIDSVTNEQLEIWRPEDMDN